MSIPWLTTKSLSAGDWSFLFKETIEDFSWPFAVRPGGYPPLDFFFQATAKILNSLGFSWPLIERLVWFWPFLILTAISCWYLVKTVFGRSKYLLFVICYLLFGFNTYILMVVGGGQMGVAMAYALAPLVLGLFINQFTTCLPARQGSRVKELKNSLISNSLIKNCLIPGFILGFQVMFDPRIALLTLSAVIFYGLINQGLASLKKLVLPVLVALGLHSWWLLPAILARGTALPAGYGESGWVEFLSFADFSNSLSLLHPNWPENIFGKTYFMRPEFLLLPILAFSSLLFINQLTTCLPARQGSRVKELKNSLINNSLINNKTILYFNFLGLIGAFLAKGIKPPFGGVYLWLFNNFPGMNMFRDPTKFYTLVALSYSILIPFSLNRFRVKPGMTIGFFLLYWLFLLQPAWRGQLGGTFKAREVPQEYVLLKDFIHNQEDFFQTLWIPKRQRFGFSSQAHPSIESPDLLSKEELSAQGVKYIIIPFDSEGEIFLADRKYDPQQRLDLEEELDRISWLKKIDIAEKIAVYQLIR